MSTPNFLRDTLRQSLQDVLSEVSFDDSMARAPVAAMPPPRLQNTNSFGFASSSHSAANNDSSAMKQFSFYNQGPSNNFNVGSGGSPQVRPSAALGISSEELMMAAAAEKRMLEEKKMLMNLDRARAAMAFRQKVLQDALHGRTGGGSHLNGNSLLSMFQTGGGNLHMNMAQQQHQHQHQGLAAFAKHFPMMPMSQPAAATEPPKDALQVLGTSLRQSSSPYIDVSDAKDPDPNDSRVKKTRGGVTEPFPERLHRLLKEIADDGNGDVISFYNHGRAFGIHKPEKFVSEIIPKYFKQSRLSSFQRQLNLYGFKRITSGRDAGGYYHELFLQGRPNMCLHMRRVGLPKGEDRRKMRSKNVQVDPDFYSMKPVALTTQESM